jgi:hypothetical protein
VGEDEAGKAYGGCTLAACGAQVASPSDVDARSGSQGAWLAREDRAAAPGASGLTTGTRCEDATVILGDERMIHVTLARGPTGAPCRASDSPQRFYVFNLPPHHRALIAVSPTLEPWRAVVRVTDRCDADACLADGASFTPGAPVRLTVDNPGDAPVTRVVSVSAARGRGRRLRDLSALRTARRARRRRDRGGPRPHLRAAHGRQCVVLG